MKTALLSILLTTTVAFAAPLLKREVVEKCSDRTLNQLCVIAEVEGMKFIGASENLSIDPAKVKCLPVCCARTNF
jgi:hypothetical protein